ncbi:MAG: PAS-domain containing protein [Hoeflea sp.]|nr:PAS-domain containing protein [Alphaproteobacteria bacterium]MBV1725023.1 PAS-domain containing protein [Hoeflea sp.]MBU4544603.1 PAS-domain containing protein [Alphaproteobacteria bacterium]MBU4552834.1 PAS-domain containing protein [Alphaproteobacteria bacterium]MBV1761043.1 PAS-domain containing protein [Hoeflea sp.]
MPVKRDSLRRDSLGRGSFIGLKQAVASRLVACRRRFLTGTALVTGFLLAPAGAALAQTTGGLSVSSMEVVNFAMVIGAISAAMISAIWLIRERGKIDLENAELRTSLADANAKLSRHQALIIDRDRQIVVWDGVGLPAEVLGNLAPETGAPQRPSDFLAFGRWLEPRSAAGLDEAIDRLRAQAERFDLIVETIRGHVVEAQGRVSGGRAFVRFVTLSNVRAELAELKTERNRLLVSLDTFQALLDVIDMPVWLRGPDAKLIWVNNAYTRAVEGADRQDVLTRGLELLGTAARERVRAAVTPERPFLDKISTVIHGHRRFLEVADVKTPSGNAGLALDVSIEEDLREELRRTIQSHAETLDHLATPVAIFDRDQRLQFHNQAFQRLWELDTPFLARRPDNAEFLERLRAEGKLPEPHAWREWKEQILSAYRAVETTPQLWHLPDGQTLNVFANAHPQGGVTWVFENLTEKVDLETRYNTLLQVQGETIDNLAEGVAVFGPDGKIRLSNPSFRALWGLNEQQVKPGTHIRLISEACEPSHREADGWKLFAGAITGFEDERRTREGRIELTTGLILDYAIVPLPNGQTMIAFVNVTDSVGAERMLTEKNEALRKADALKNEFVQHVSYELRSPLTNIIGFTELLRTPDFGALNERQSEYLDHISTSSSVLLTIVNDILDLATVDAGIMRLEPDAVNIAALFSEAGDQISDRLKESGLSLEIDIAEAPEEMIGDHQRLKQILFKLLMNAANFAPDGSVVRLSCTQEDDSVVFSVSDSGPGIPEGARKDVFARFETNGQTGRRRGAGLGLSIVQSFVGLHNGTVSIEGGTEGGATVICRFPTARPLARNAAE